ncbi:MAG TPA: hypothetical protein DCF65_16445 [Chloroflexi bacterium]|jgi:hypothetical protein|nr:hypothetical protein [Chloroflexota bacterium]HAF19928.1 hypothetical protein [Chloroflexota bacterium]
MPAGCRRVSFATLALMAAALVSLAASTAQAAANPVSIAVKVGYSGFVKAGQWMPVAIDVTNKGQDVDGTLEVSTTALANGPPIGPAIYMTHVSLASGATKHLKTYVIEDQAPSPVSVRLVQNGQVVATGGSVGGSATTTLIGVLSDQPTALDTFAAVHPASISASVVHLSLEDLGDSALLLRAFDLLAIDDFATDSLTAAQRGAITDYVQNGGMLVLGTGASWRKTLAGVSSTLMPMTIDATATLNSVAALGQLSGVEVASGALNTGATAWLSEGGRPLLAERFVGGGMVTLATFDWNQEPVAGWSGANVLLRQILVRTLFSSASAQTSALSGAFGGSGSSISMRSTALSQVLGNLPGLDLPSLLLIGLLVIAYVLLVGPVNYLTLRALHRRALAWVTLPLIAILASVGAFGAGLFTKGQSVQTNQVSIIHLEAGWDRAYAESYTGVLAPTRGDYQVNVAGARPWVGPISSFSNGYGPSTAVIRVNADNNSILMPGMTAFVLRGFATEGVVDAPQLVATAKLVNGKLTGTIQNNSNLRFTDLVVLAGDGYQVISGLAPGAGATFSVTPKPSNPYAGPPAYMTIYGNYFNGPPPSQTTDADRQNLEKSSILSLVAGGGFNGISSTISPMVVAWTQQPYEQITVEGAHPRSTAESAVVIPLAIGAIGAGLLPAGLVVSRFTDIDGTTQNGPPGAVFMQSGTATYDFTPQLVPGTHLTGATLDSTSQSPKGGGFPGQSLSAEAWDWSQSVWVPVAYTPLGTTTLPAGAVNPSSGEVRVRIKVNGQALLGAISLTGTVQ